MAKKVLICLFLFLITLGLTASEAMAFSFSPSIDPQQGSVDKEGTLKAAINIYSSSSDKERISLFPAIEPKGIKIRFNPSSCRPSCSSIMTISVSEDAESRNYSIPIIATGSGVTRTATYYLTIASPYSFSREDLLNKLQAQIAAIKAEILRLQKELARLISSGFFEK